MDDSPLSRVAEAPPVAHWVAERIDEHGKRLGTLERDQMGLQSSVHKLEVRMGNLTERVAENHATVSAQLAQMTNIISSVRDRQIAQDAAVQEQRRYQSEIRENRKEVGGWVRWLAPGALALLLILMNLGEKIG